MAFIKAISIRDSIDLNIFLNNLGDSKNSFRYFNNRDITIINNHLLTCLLYVNDNPVAYAHLDKENDIIWLGIAVIESEKGKGFGNMLMQYLKNFAIEQNLKEIFLSVDIQNQNAIKLYQKFNFKFETHKNQYYIFKLNLL